MSVTLTLMSNEEPVKKIGKTPTAVTTLTGTFRDETDLTDPEILIEYSGTFSGINYFYVAEIDRYYFITKKVSVRTNLWRITGHCDLLMSASDVLLDTYAVIARQENAYNLYLNDDMFKVSANPRLQIANFPNKFEGESFVLVMNGANYTYE